MAAIVTKDTLRNMLNEADSARKAAIIGRALVVLFERQTEAERMANTTNNLNSIGFASCDAKAGCLSAKYFLRHRTLLDWQVEKWMRTDRTGYPRICKYARQLNEAAEQKRARQAQHGIIV